jgi:hypothetical protein
LRFNCFQKRDLLIWKARAYRGRVWFKTLNRLERGLLDSVVKVVDTVRSTLLVKVLSSIVKKLQMALESPIKRMMKEVGEPLACKISLIAQSWGNRSAQQWKYDRGFVRFLAVMRVNMFPSSRTD